MFFFFCVLVDTFLSTCFLYRFDERTAALAIVASIVQSFACASNPSMHWNRFSDVLSLRECCSDSFFPFSVELGPEIFLKILHLLDSCIPWLSGSPNSPSAPLSVDFSSSIGRSCNSDLIRESHSRHLIVIETCLLLLRANLRFVIASRVSLEDLDLETMRETEAKTPLDSSVGIHSTLSSQRKLTAEDYDAVTLKVWC